MSARTPSLLVALAALLALPSIVLAHPGPPTGGFLAGVSHPLSGIDHLLAMFAIGIWGAQLGRREFWQIAVTFVGFMLIGAALPLAGLQITGTAVDQLIAASLLATGLFIANASRIPAWGAIALAGLFALFHGFAHASEMHGGTPVASFTTGVTCTTLFLMACGAGAALLLKRTSSPVAIRLAGISVALVAALLLGGVR